MCLDVVVALTSSDADADADANAAYVYWCACPLIHRYGINTYHFDICLDGVEMVTVTKTMIATTRFRNALRTSEAARSVKGSKAPLAQEGPFTQILNLNSKTARCGSLARSPESCSPKCEFATAKTGAAATSIMQRLLVSLMNFVAERDKARPRNKVT